jgi:hypothetical protein
MWSGLVHEDESLTIKQVGRYMSTLHTHPTEHMPIEYTLAEPRL